jgi:hypothetical protein
VAATLQGQGINPQLSIVQLSIQQCLAIHPVHGSRPVTTWYPEAQVSLPPP